MERGYGYHMGQTSIVLTFDQALDAVTAEDADDYRITGPAGRTIAVRKAVYDPADLTVTLYPVDRVNVHKTYKLIVDGTSPHGLTNTSGQSLDGTDRGSPDSNYDGLLTWRNRFSTRCRRVGTGEGNSDAASILRRRDRHAIALHANRVQTAIPLHHHFTPQPNLRFPETPPAEEKVFITTATFSLMRTNPSELDHPVPGNAPPTSAQQAQGGKRGRKKGRS